MVIIAKVAISALFVAPNPDLTNPEVLEPAIQEKAENAQELAESCLEPRNDLPPEVLEFCEVFNAQNSFRIMGGTIGCYTPP